MRPKVSTIIPAYNAERTVRCAIDSALSQQYEGHEIIVVDDGSTDSTASILREYQGTIRVITRANGGAAAARNTGVACSNGKFIAFLDADDLWLPGKLETMIRAIDRAPRAVLAFSDFAFVDEHLTEYHASSIGATPGFKELMTRRPFSGVLMREGIMTSTWVLEREAFDAVGGFCERFKAAWACEDAWMLVLLRDLGEFVYVAEKLTLYRVARSLEMADKYGPGVDIFIMLLKKRYGSHSRPLVRDVKLLKCRWLLTKLAHQLDRGERLGALLSFSEIAKLRPVYFASREFTKRLRVRYKTKGLRKRTGVGIRD